MARPIGHVNPIRVEQVGEQLGAVDQARAGPGEGGRPVDRPDPLGAGRRDLGGVTTPAPSLACRASQPQGIATTTSGLDAAISSQSRSGTCRHARRAAARRPPISIISGTQWPPVKGGSSHSSGRTVGRSAPSTAVRTACQPPLEREAKRVGSVVDARDLAEPADVVEHLVEVVRVERDDPRPALQPGGHGDDVVIGDGAHLAERLGDDQVDVELRQRRLVEGVEMLALAGQPPDGGVDLARCEVVGHEASRQMTLAGRLGGVVALVGDGDDLIAQAEGE